MKRHIHVAHTRHIDVVALPESGYSQAVVLPGFSLTLTRDISTGFLFYRAKPLIEWIPF